MKLKMREINHIKQTGKYIKSVTGDEVWVGETESGEIVEIKKLVTHDYHRVRKLKPQEIAMLVK